MEKAVASDIYCKWIYTNAFSWTPRKFVTICFNVKFLMLLVIANIFWDNIKYTKHAVNKSLFK
jgi:hypothetical protein